MSPNTPLGPSVQLVTSGREYLLDRTHFMKKAVIIDSQARDSSSSTLRKGLALGKITSSGKHMQYDTGNSPAGINVLRGFLDTELDLKDWQGNNVDAVSEMVIFGRVDANQTFGISATAIATDGTNGCLFIWGTSG